MNPNDPLADLADIHLPNSISAWPLAPGWWVLIILACAGLVALFILWSKWHASRLYRRQALAQLNSIEASNNKISSNKASSNSQLVATLELLKQTANTAYPDQHFGSLGIAEFKVFLQKSCSEAVFEKVPDSLEAALYSKSVEFDPLMTEHFIASAKTWIAKHVAEHKLEYQAPC